MDTINLRLITPYKAIYEQDVNLAILNTTQGEAAIQPDHEPYVTILENGTVRALFEGRQDTFVVLGGYALFLDNKLTIMSRVADTPNQIAQTIERLKQEREESQAHDHESELEIQLLEAGLRRSLIQAGSGTYIALKESQK